MLGKIKKIIVDVFGFFGYKIEKNKYSSTKRLEIEKFALNGSEREWRQFSMYSHVINKTRNIPGDIAEFGVSSGTSLISLIRLNEIYNKNVPHLVGKKNIFGFDTFEGLPYLDEEYDLNNDKDLIPVDMKVGGYNANKSYNELLNYCNKFKNVKLYKGIFEETIPLFKNDNKHFSFSLIHIDCDLYKSTKVALEGILERLNVGGIILFDEIFHLKFPGETKGFFEVYNDLTNTNPKFKLEFKRLNSMPWKWYGIRKN